MTTERRAVTSTDLVRVDESNSRTAAAISSRLQEMKNEREPYDYSDLLRIVAEENARLTPRYSHEREVGHVR